MGKRLVVNSVIVPFEEKLAIHEGEEVTEEYLDLSRRDAPLTWLLKAVGTPRELRGVGIAHCRQMRKLPVICEFRDAIVGQRGKRSRTLWKRAANGQAISRTIELEVRGRRWVAFNDVKKVLLQCNAEDLAWLVREARNDVEKMKKRRAQQEVDDNPEGPRECETSYHSGASSDASDSSDRSKASDDGEDEVKTYKLGETHSIREALGRMKQSGIGVLVSSEEWVCG